MEVKVNGPGRGVLTRVGPRNGACRSSEALTCRFPACSGKICALIPGCRWVHVHGRAWRRWPADDDGGAGQELSARYRVLDCVISADVHTNLAPIRA